MAQATVSPVCPKCGGDTRLRKSKYGDFYGCSKYPDCKGIVAIDGNEGPNGQAKSASGKQPISLPKPGPIVAPITKMSGSQEQEDIWEFLLNGTEHGVVEAVAGSGKTFTMIQACLRIPKTIKVGFIAFNKHIAVEATGKLQASGCNHVTCSTYHSLGLRAIRATYPNVKISEYKVDDIWESVPRPFDVNPDDWRSIGSLVKRLVGFAKNYLLSEEDPDLADRLERLADHHAVDLNGIGSKALTYVPYVLRECRNRAHLMVDFDDMVWIPVVMKLRFPFSFDVLIIDEAQDTNKTQQELALLACPSGRIVVVGDRHQSIYGFRGADITAIPSMIERLNGTDRGVRCFPLTMTRRCPKSHVTLAQSLVPQIRAMDDAPEGKIVNVTEAVAVSKMFAGDLVLCRCNAPLIPVAYELIKRGTKAVIRGRDIGSGLISLIEKLEKHAASLPELALALREYRHVETERLSQLGDKAEGRLSALYDRCDCLSELMSTVDSIRELKDRISSLFADFEADGRPKEAVVLSTVHRGKGLESEVVYVLQPELIPHPMAKQEWEQEQEANLAYVAATRAKYDAKTGAVGTLVFCGMTPDIYRREDDEQ